MFDTTYEDRRGFDPTFLLTGSSAVRVMLPTLRAALARSAAPLLTDKTRTRLDYHHYSVVMHRTRRFAIYSAANVDFGGRFELKRPKDVWRIELRTSLTHCVRRFASQEVSSDRHQSRR